MSDDMEKRESILIDKKSFPAARKRSYASDRPISPPPLRRKTNATSSLSQDLPIKNRFEILSWNVNGVTPLLKENYLFLWTKGRGKRGGGLFPKECSEETQVSSAGVFAGGQDQ
jgi:hypothetical protein